MERLTVPVSQNYIFTTKKSGLVMDPEDLPLILSATGGSLLGMLTGTPHQYQSHMEGGDECEGSSLERLETGCTM